MPTQGQRAEQLPGLDVRINGPFNDLTPLQMEQKLTSFLEETDLGGYREFFRKGMFLAQDPQGLDHDESVQYFAGQLKPLVGTSVDLKLTKREKHCLERDKIDTTDGSTTRWKINMKKWRLPQPLWELIALCALGAVVQGWDQSAVNSAQLFYQHAFKLYIGDKRQRPPEGIQPRNWIVGLVNSAPYLCCVFSCWLTVPLNRFAGRRGAIFVSCLFSAVFALAQAFSRSWQALFAFRFLMGLGIGPKSATIPIYAAESAPENVRGGLVMMWQVFTALGIMFGYLSGVVLGGLSPEPGKYSHDNVLCPLPTAQSPMSTLLATRCSLGWRLIIGSPTIAPVLLAICIFMQPESPRWLIGKGHKLRKDQNVDRANSYYLSAWKALSRLRDTDVQAARDMFLIYHLLQREQEMLAGEERRKMKWYQKGALELLTNRRNWRAFRASLICMFAQQFCGVNIIVYYSSYVLKTANSKASTRQVLAFSMGFGVINFFLALPAFYTIDTFGRRSLLLLTFPFLALSQLLTTIGLALPSPSNSQSKMAIAGMYLFGVFYSPGEGPVPFVYSAESMPLYIRDVGMGCVTSVNWLFNWLIAFTAPEFFDALESWGAFLWYSVWCILLWVLIFWYVPETRILSLEQLDVVFGQTSSEFRKFAWDDAKWLFKRYILGHKNLESRPQFHERIQQSESFEMQEMRASSPEVLPTRQTRSRSH